MLPNTNELMLLAVVLGVMLFAFIVLASSG